MARQRHLSKAPIREAVLDLQIPDADIGVQDLIAGLADLGTFAEIHELKRGSFVLQLSPEGEPQGRSEGGDSIGVRATSQDGHWVVQFRKDGLTFSRLPPCPDWTAFAVQARPFIDRFLSQTQPPYVERLGLRYINHFRLPYPSNMNDYFVWLPVIPAALPQFVSNMLARVTIHDPARDFSAHITQGVLDDLDPEKIGFILDIDVFRTAELPPAAKPLWETLEGLRVFKNQVFFELITERNAEAHE